ncbi:penicillin-binding protein [Clostridium gelidum]|uniref:Penicillin-binding protein n=1 Tax=Clostridium gelidum TaxID=704125 RepID=A0ABM7T0F5_9CLOT|nr:penicillin-binding transpeptidase domain-containing protein [Clostridium gelidum]BCZ44696.1 penicillin-binding protein [Clostridium gelidum]
MIVNKPTDKKKKKTSRYTVLCIIMGLIFGSIILRLLYVQVFSYEEYKERANVTSTRFVADKAPRGKIYDQKGNILATNKQTYTITYTKTDNSDKQFYTTMKELFKILDENKETIQDTLPLKIDSDNGIYFEYKSNDKESQNHEDLRFKKDRGISDTLKNKNKKLKDVEALSDEQNAQLDQDLLKMTPEDSFYALVRSYNLIELVDSDYKTKAKSNIYSEMTDEELTNIILNAGYTLNDIRKFMVIKDSIKMQSFKGDKVATIAGNIKRDTAFIVYQKKYDLSGIDVSLAPIRYYPFDNLASSVLGYVSSINETQKEGYELKGYDVSSDLIGTSGIESAFEEQLKGVKGGTTIKVNSQGTKTQDLFSLQSYPGKDVHLTIDSDIQYAAEKGLTDAMENLQKNVPDNDVNDGSKFPNATRGAIVAVEVKTGRILSLVSYPNVNPNVFAVPGQLTSEENKQYFNPDYETFGKQLIQKMGLRKNVDELFPIGSDGYRTDKYDLYPRSIYNYATTSLIQPGSTFKPVTAVAGLESGVISPNTIINDTGKFNIHPETFGKSFNPSGLEDAMGPINLTTAIGQSINYYFYETAYRMYMQGLEQGKSKIEALDSIAKYAWQFGLGVDPNDPSSKQKETTGIEIGEKFGQTYNFASWKESQITYAKFTLRDALENGEYAGKTFIKFDYGFSDDDNDQVKNSKQAIKDKVIEKLKKVGTADEKIMLTQHDEFAKDVMKDVINIMEHSEKYKSRIAEIEQSGKKVDLNNQAKTIAEAIAQFTINDKPGEIRTPGEIVNASIGQGMDSFTPMQLASYISTLANGGTRYKLHLVDKITDNDGNIVQEFKPEVLNTVSMSKSTQDAVKEGMKKVNNSVEGTAATAFIGFPIQTAGKTGTADYAKDQRENGRKPYATYVGYAPADDPQIAVVAVVFDGGHGGNIASAVRAVYEAYFKDELLKTSNYASTSESFKKYVVDNPNHKN